MCRSEMCWRIFDGEMQLMYEWERSFSIYVLEEGGWNYWAETVCVSETTDRAESWRCVKVGRWCESNKYNPRTTFFRLTWIDVSSCVLRSNTFNFLSCKVSLTRRGPSNLASNFEWRSSTLLKAISLTKISGVETQWCWQVSTVSWEYEFAKIACIGIE